LSAYLVDSEARVLFKAGKNRDGYFDNDDLIQNWFIRHLQILGEAARALPDEIRQKAWATVKTSWDHSRFLPPIFSSAFPPSRRLEVTVCDFKIATRRRFARSSVSIDAGELIREVAYAGMAKRTRAERHQRLAAHLLATGGDPETVGTHLERAFRLRAELGRAHAGAEELRLGAARQLGAAGATAMDRCDPVRAADLLHRSVALFGPSSAEGLPPAQRLGEALFAVGRAEEGREVLSTVRTGAGGAGDRRTAAHARLYLAVMDPGGDFAASVPAGLLLAAGS